MENTELVIKNQEQALAQLATSAAKTKQEQPRVGMDPFMKMGNDGTWTYGQTNVEVQPGSLWAFDPFSYRFGYTCWTDYAENLKKKNENKGKVTVAMGADPVLPENLPKNIDPDTGNEWEWTPVVEISITCINGEDKGVQAVYQTSSTGGLRALSDYLDELIIHIAEGTPVAIVELKSDSYPHTQWGKTYFPVLDYSRWAKIDDTSVAEEPKKQIEDKPQPHAAVEEKGDSAENGGTPPPATRRRRPAI